MSKNPFLQVHPDGRPVVLDGGLATQLEADGHTIDGELWSALLLQTNPQSIVAAHRAYLEAGAECLISASYQASRNGFANLGLNAAAADALIAASVTHACTARDEYCNAENIAASSVWIAASIGPYGAVLADGSEYTGNYGVNQNALRNFHGQRLALLDSTQADILACETIPDTDEAVVLSELLREANTPAWVSFSCRDERHISDGTQLRDVCQLFADHPGVFALGINCTPPHLITPLIAEIRVSAPDKKIVVYPNSGETYHATDNSWSGVPCDKAAGFDVATWVEAGASMIGGCCRTGPREIAAIKRRLAL